MGELRKFVPKRFRPIQAIEWVIALFTAVGGLFIFSPLYDISVDKDGPSALAVALSHPYMILVWSTVLLCGSLLVMFGLAKKMPQLRSAGWFVIILARTFQIATIILTTGWYPISWIYPLTLTFIMLILWGVARTEVYRDAH